jgi:hypothetical protein
MANFRGTSVFYKDKEEETATGLPVERLTVTVGVHSRLRLSF